jgi:nucleotide-binding universal stress UspA family protein
MPAHATHTDPVDATRVDTLPPDGPVLVATDGGEESDAAFPLAAALADRGRSGAHVLSVVQPTNVPMYGVDGIVLTLDDEAGVRDARSAATRAQLTRTVSSRADWPITVATGEPAREIAVHAETLRARLIVTGRGRHGLVDRIVGGESVLRILQLGDTPVLAVEPTLTSPPRRVLVAVDFSPFSTYALKVALSVAAPDARITLTHVAPYFDHSVPYLAQLSATYTAQVETAFKELRATIPEGRWQVEQSLMHGNAIERLPEFAGELDADLVVTATHGYGFVRRFVLGSVAAALLRKAPCSVLAVPGSAQTAAVARAVASPNARTCAFSLDRMDHELATMSDRNTGRQCTVELDSLDDGAQTLGRDLPLRGLSFDARTRELTMMFGARGAQRAHLSHRVAGVTAVQLTSNAGGVDQALRVQHDAGQTLLLFR